MDHDTDRDRPALLTRRVMTWALSSAPLWGFVALVTIVRLVFLIGFSPFTLVEDEAHYWEWSRLLDWSYYSKGPGVAWAIWASTSVFGDVEWAVRLPAVLASAVGTLAVAGLARDIFGDRRAALLAAIAYQSMPGVQITGILMTIDGPYLACWALAAWAGWRALATGSGPAWVALGAALAAGFVFKYTILLLPPGMLLFALLKRGHVRSAGAGWIALGAGVALLGLVPVGLWNAGHDWATVRHLLGHLGAPGGDIERTADDAGWSYSPMWTLEFLAMNLGVAGAVLPMAVLAVINIGKARARGPAGWRPAGPAYLYCTGAPVLLFYLGVTLVTNTEANWAMAGFVTLCPVAAWAALDGIHRVDAGIRFTWNIGLAVLLLFVAGLPIFGALAASGERPLGMPLHRLSGMRTLAGDAAGRLDALAERTGKEPFVMTVHYGRASQLAFYLPGRPTVYAGGRLMGGGRKTQYDIWPHTDLSRPESNDPLRGRPALLFGGSEADWRRAFRRVEPIGALEGEPKANRESFLGFGYRGFDRRNRQPADERP